MRLAYRVLRNVTSLTTAYNTLSDASVSYVGVIKQLLTISYIGRESLKLVPIILPQHVRGLAKNQQSPTALMLLNR